MWGIEDLRVGVRTNQPARIKFFGRFSLISAGTILNLEVKLHVNLEPMAGVSHTYNA